MPKPRFNMAETAQILWQPWVAVGFGGVRVQPPNPMVTIFVLQKIHHPEHLAQNHGDFYCGAFTTALTLTSTCSHMMADWRDLIKDELSQLHRDAVGRRETIVPMIAQLPLPCDSQAVTDELAVMQSHFAGTVPGLVFRST